MVDIGIITIGNFQPKVVQASDLYFQCASVSKVVCALAIMQLVEHGFLDLEADVNTYLHSWKLHDAKGQPTSKITLRHLLSHSGHTTVVGFDGYKQDLPLPHLDDILNGRPPANNGPILCDGEPGSFIYSGGGTMVLQKVLEEATKTRYEDYVQEHIFSKIPGCIGSFTVPDEPKALPHTAAGDPLADGFHVYPEAAAGGL